MICVRLPVADLRRLRAVAKRQERPMTEVLREAVARLLARQSFALGAHNGSREDGALKAVCTYLEPEQHEALAKVAAKLGVPAAVLVREAVRRVVS